MDERKDERGGCKDGGCVCVCVCVFCDITSDQPFSKVQWHTQCRVCAVGDVHIIDDEVQTFSGDKQVGQRLGARGRVRACRLQVLPSGRAERGVTAAAATTLYMDQRGQLLAAAPQPQAPQNPSASLIPLCHIVSGRVGGAVNT